MLSVVLKRSFGLSRPLVYQTASRSLSSYPQPPLMQGEGAKDDVIPDDQDQATGRERAELLAFGQGKDYFQRKPVKMKEGEGTFENPVLVPSELDQRIIGMVPPGQDGPIWWELKGNETHYVEELKLHFKLYNPLVNDTVNA